jgi:hypothetical protein
VIRRPLNGPSPARHRDARCREEATEEETNEQETGLTGLTPFSMHTCRSCVGHGNRYLSLVRRDKMTTQFKVTKYDFKIETNPGTLKVKETSFPIKVRYEGPYFYCNVHVSCIIDDDKEWVVGFVQTCDDIYLRHTYASGNYTQWEFPTPIGDYFSWNGGNSFPYYAYGAPNNSGRYAQAGTGAFALKGPVKREANRVAALSMNDNLSSNVQWWDPVPPGQTNFNPKFPHTLTKIERKQKFTTYIVASPGHLKNCKNNYKVLSKSIWRMHFKVDVDCTKPVGTRGTTSLEDDHTVMYKSKDGSGLKLRPEVFVEKCANEEQKLVGYASDGTLKKALIPW